MCIEPNDDSNVRGDAFKTLFVARLSYDTTEKDLEREFGRFGAIERVQQAPLGNWWLRANDIDSRYVLSQTRRRSTVVEMPPNPKRRKRVIEATLSWFTSGRKT